MRSEHFPATVFFEPQRGTWGICGIFTRHRGQGEALVEEAQARRPHPMVGRPLMQLRNIVIGALCCIAMLVAAPSAFGAQGYVIPGGSIEQQVDGKCTHNCNPPCADSAESQCEPSHNPPPAVHQASKLPFTGLDIGLVVAAGAVLLAMGFGIRRLSRSEV